MLIKHFPSQYNGSDYKGRIVYNLDGGGGGGGSPQPTSTSQTTIPEYAQPYMERLLGKSEAATEAPYQTYGGERLATTTPEQTQARGELAGLQTPGQFQFGSQLAGTAGLMGLQAGQYQPGIFAAPLTQAQQLRAFQMQGPQAVTGMQQFAPQMATAQTDFAPNLQQFAMGPARDVSALGVTSRDIQAAQTGFAPNLQQFGMGPAERVGIMQLSTPTMQAAQTRFDPGLQRFQMEAPEAVAGREVTTGTFTAPGVAQQFMSPYMQQVVDVQKQEAIRDAQKAQLAQNLAAARQGTYGGARQTLAMTERERNLQDQLARIQATGSQSAYEAAQRGFEAEQGRGLQAQQLSGQFGMQAALANQQARQAAARENLQAALGVQQLGAQTGLQTTLANLSNEQQAAVQNQAAQLQTQGMSSEQALRAALANQQAGLTVGQQNLAAQLQTQQLGTQTGMQVALANLNNEQQARVQSEANRLQAQGMSQDAALRAALANQQAGLTVGQQNLASQLGVQQLGTQTGLQAALANLSSAQQANVQNQAAILQTQGLNAQQAMQAALANQQAQQQTALQNLQARLGVQQLGAQTGLESQRLNQQALLEAQRMAEQSRQYGAGVGLQGAQAAMQAAGTLGQLGATQQQSELDRLRAQEAAGALTQQEQQAALDLAYQDFLAQQRYPYTQLGFMSDILRGSGNLAGTGGRAVYEAPPSTGSQLLGLAGTLGGAYLAGGRRFAEGGEVKGLGAVKRYAEGGSVIDDMIDVDKLTPEQIEQTRDTGARRDVPDYVLLGELQAKLNEIEQAKARGIPDTTVAEDIRAKAMQEIGSGIDSIPIADNYYRSDEEVAQLAGGGIIAFANQGFVDPMFTSGFTEEGLTPMPERTSPTENMTLQELQEYYRQKQKDETTGLPQVLDEAKKAPPKAEPKKEPPKAAPKKEEGVGIPDKDQKKVAKAEDGYEKALRAELDKTDMSEDDKLQALGFALMKAGSKAMAGKSRYAMQNIGEGIEAGVDEYVKTLNQSKKDKKQLTKDLAEYGLAKERLRIAERGVEETAATRRETAAQTAALRMQANITKAREEYNSMYGMVPRFLDKEGTKVNPKWKSFSEYLREQGVDLGGGPAPVAASGERPPLSSFRG